MPYIDMRPFMADEEKFRQYVEFPDQELLTFNRYNIYDEKINQVVERFFRIEVLKEDDIPKERKDEYRGCTVLNPLSKDSKISQLEKVLGVELPALHSDQQTLAREKHDYLLFTAQRELRDGLNEYMANTIAAFRPNYEEGRKLLAVLMEQPSFQEKVNAVIWCYRQMVQRINDVKKWGKEFN